MRTYEMGKCMALLLMALSINAASAIPTKQAPNPNMGRKALTVPVKPASSDRYKEAGLEVNFFYKGPSPSAPDYEQNKQCIIAIIKNLSKTKILRADTDSWIPDNSTSAKQAGFFTPKIRTVRDNFGNSFDIGSIEPRLMKETDSGAIYPEETKEIRIYFYARLIPNTKSLSFYVPEDFVGNSNWFEISVPVLNTPEPVSKPVDTNVIYTGPDLERIK